MRGNIVTAVYCWKMRLLGAFYSLVMRDKVCWKCKNNEKGERHEELQMNIERKKEENNWERERDREREREGRRERERERERARARRERARERERERRREREWEKFQRNTKNASQKSILCASGLKVSRSIKISFVLAPFHTIPWMSQVRLGLFLFLFFFSSFLFFFPSLSLSSLFLASLLSRAAFLHSDFFTLALVTLTFMDISFCPYNFHTYTQTQQLFYSQHIELTQTLHYHHAETNAAHIFAWCICVRFCRSFSSLCLSASLSLRFLYLSLPPYLLLCPLRLSLSFSPFLSISPVPSQPDFSYKRTRTRICTRTCKRTRNTHACTH